ncbi:MAG TPA: TetR/AcrR family transcriptional regulator [Galbitalea sp.]|nr:TetR/AcrR family transcriptional regulator [Galbitalea sp.]
MTDSVKTRSSPSTLAQPGKRERLVAAATDLLYRQGVEKTTLADIAQAAEVPLGNVYYYFKTKDAIVDAVVEAHVQYIEESTASLDRRYRSPKGRLKGLIRMLTDQRDVIAQFGCPDGTLCSELVKRTGDDDHDATRLVEIPVAWAEKQFRAMGRHDARDLAVEFMASYQGTAVVAQALREPALLSHEARRLERWIDSLQPTQ